MLDSYFTIDVVFGPSEQAGGADGAIISVHAVGPSGSWQVSVPTYGPSLASMINRIAMWPQIAASSRPASVGEIELDWVTPLEGGIEFALVATQTGLSVEVRDSWTSGGLQPHTRVPVTTAELDEFARHLSGTIEGTSLGASLGTSPDYARHPAVCRPLVAIESGRIINLAEPHLPQVECSITGVDIDWLIAVLPGLSRDLGPLSAWEPPEKTMWVSTSGCLTLVVTYYSDDDNVRLADITLGTRTHGPLWTLTVGPEEAYASLTHTTHARGVLFGQVSSRLPL